MYFVGVRPASATQTTNLTFINGTDGRTELLTEEAALTAARNYIKAQPAYKVWILEPTKIIMRKETPIEEIEFKRIELSE